MTHTLEEMKQAWRNLKHYCMTGHPKALMKYDFAMHTYMCPVCGRGSSMFTDEAFYAAFRAEQSKIGSAES